MRLSHNTREDHEYTNGYSEGYKEGYNKALEDTLVKNQENSRTQVIMITKENFKESSAKQLSEAFDTLKKWKNYSI
jgi:flagellar biosynthesis/type III secretory pathway protein FliH